MKTIIENPAHRYSNRTVVGAIILVIGSLLLIGQFDFVGQRIVEPDIGLPIGI